MALHFDLTAIPEENRTIVADRDGDPTRGEDFAKGDRVMSPITNALIWATMSVGLNQQDQNKWLAATYRSFTADVTREIV